MFRSHFSDPFPLEHNCSATETTVSYNMPFNLNTLYVANEVAAPEKFYEKFLIEEIFFHTAHEVERRRSMERFSYCGAGALFGSLMAPPLGHYLGSYPDFMRVQPNFLVSTAIALVLGLGAYALGKPECLSFLSKPFRKVECLSFLLDRIRKAEFYNKYSDAPDAMGDKEVCIKTQKLLDKKCNFHSSSPS